MWRYIELLSFQPLSAVRLWRREVEGGRNPREIKVLLAQEIVARFHDQAAADGALAEFEARFRRGETPEDIPECTLHAADGALPLVQALKQAGLTPSTSEALRMIEQGGVKLNGEKISDKALRLTRGESVIAQVGKRKFARITIR
jgi:tyrosyl-tRNA synthetase